MTDKKKTTAIATRLPRELALTQRSLTALLRLYDATKYNVLVPDMVMDDVPDGCRLVPSVICVDPNPNNGEVYPIQGSKKVGIGKAKLNEIALALGGTWIVSRRVDESRHPYYVEWEAVGMFVLPDGTTHREPGNKTIDLRDDNGAGDRGADGRGMSDRQLAGARMHIQSNAETKAKNRAIRAAAKMQTGYLPAQLANPFLCVKLAVDPRSDIGSRAAIAALTGATALLHGPPPVQLPAGRVVDAEIEPSDQGDVRPPDQKADEAGGDGSHGPSLSEVENEKPP